LQDAYGVDEVRYYLTRYIPVNQDGEFSTGQLERAIETDLANDLGNLLNRMVGLAEKNNTMTVTPSVVWEQAALDVRDESWNALEDVKNFMQDRMFHLALGRIWKFINVVNAYFHEQEPWKIAKKDSILFMQILSATAHSLHTIALLLWPVMPHKMSMLLDSLGVTFALHGDMLDELEGNPWHHTFQLKKIPTLFAKPLVEAEMNQTEETKKPEKVSVETNNYISIDDVVKVELLVGTIEQCEPVANSDKLLQFQVNFGPKGMRQILAGIKKHYVSQDLIGKQGVFVFNLKPRKMLGTQSQGMMLIAQDADGVPRLVAPAVAVPNGQRLQ
jgi:methionyl-tRNA synthetase